MQHPEGRIRFKEKMKEYAEKFSNSEHITSSKAKILINADNIQEWASFTAQMKSNEASPQAE
jgi:hypothetical protein